MKSMVLCTLTCCPRFSVGSDLTKAIPATPSCWLSSHHVGLLDDLEKEELFIVEKDDGGGTRIYGAQDVTGLRRGRPDSIRSTGRAYLAGSQESAEARCGGGVGSSGGALYSWGLRRRATGLSSGSSVVFAMKQACISTWTLDPPAGVTPWPSLTKTGRRLRRHPDRRSISDRLVLLDSDRIVTDRAAGRDARVTASKWGLEVVLMTPNLEGACRFDCTRDGKRTRSRLPTPSGS